MDFGKLDVSKKADEGVEFNDFVGPDKKPLSELKVRLYGSDSTAANKALSKIRQSTKLSALKDLTIDSAYKQTLERNVACTASWNMVINGKDFPATPENVRKIYENTGYKWFFDQITERIEETGNFLEKADNS